MITDRSSTVKESVFPAVKARKKEVEIIRY